MCLLPGYVLRRMDPSIDVDVLVKLVGTTAVAIDGETRTRIIESNNHYKVLAKAIEVVGQVGGGRIVVRHGVYGLSQPLTIDCGGIVIEGFGIREPGASGGVRILLDHAGEGIVLGSTSEVAEIQLRNIVVDGLSKASKGIVLSKAARVLLENVTVMNVPGPGIEISADSYLNVLTKVRAYQNTNGIVINGKDNMLLACVTDRNNTDGVSISGSSNFLLLVYSGLNTRHGFFITGKGNHLISPYADSNGGHGIRLYGAGASENVIVGGFIYQNSYGVSVLDGKYNSVIGNRIYAGVTQQYGIYEEGAADYNEYIGNIVRGHLTEDIHVIGAHSRVIDYDQVVIPTSQPPNPRPGSMYFDPATGTLYIYDGSVWKSITLT